MVLLTIPKLMAKQRWLIGALKLICVVLLMKSLHNGQYLACLECPFNKGYHSSTNMTPFQVEYGKEPPPLPHFVLGETKLADLEVQLFAGDQMLKVTAVQSLKSSISY